jgi:hypothetical protein
MQSFCTDMVSWWNIVAYILAKISVGIKSGRRLQYPLLQHKNISGNQNLL